MPKNHSRVLGKGKCRKGGHGAQHQPVWMGPARGGWVGVGVGQGGQPGLTPSFSLQLLAVAWRKQLPGLPGSPRLGQELQGGNWGLGGRQGEL